MDWTAVLAIGFGMTVTGALIFGVFYGVRVGKSGYDRAAERGLRRLYEECGIPWPGDLESLPDAVGEADPLEDMVVSSEPEPRSVRIVYHTYSGVLVWFRQIRHDLVLPEETARELLRRLRNYNLTWGMSARGLIFIPFLAYGNYYAQLRNIEKQVRAMETA